MAKNFLKTHIKNNKSAFGLIELSLVLFVLAIIGSLYLKKEIIDIRNKNSHEIIKHFEIVNSAIIKYININKKLPCPAALNMVPSADNFGKSAGNNGDCLDSGIFIGGQDNNLAYGMVPFDGLNLKKKFAHDIFRNKIIYVVDKRLTTQEGFEAAIDKNNQAITITNKILNQNKKVDYILLSHGKKDGGAFQYKFANQKNISNIIDEKDNSAIINNLPPFDSNFIEKSNDKNFDDYLIGFKIENIINPRLSSQQIKICDTEITETLYNGTKFRWPAGSAAGQIVKSLDPCPQGYQNGISYPTRKCDFNGKWGKITNHCQGLCIVASGTGYSARSVTGQGSFQCDLTGYSGTINYSCNCPTTLKLINNPDFFWRYGSYTTGTNYSYNNWNIVSNQATWPDEGLNSLITIDHSRTSGQNGQNGCCTAYHPRGAGFKASNVIITIKMDKKYKIKAFDWFGVNNVHGSSRNAKSSRIDGLNSSNQWVTLLSFTAPQYANINSPTRYNLPNPDYYQTIRFVISNSWGDWSTVKIGGFRFYELSEISCDSSSAILNITGSCTAN